MQFLEIPRRPSLCPVGSVCFVKSPEWLCNHPAENFNPFRSLEKKGKGMGEGEGVGKVQARERETKIASHIAFFRNQSLNVIKLSYTDLYLLSIPSKH